MSIQLSLMIVLPMKSPQEPCRSVLCYLSHNLQIADPLMYLSVTAGTLPCVPPPSAERLLSYQLSVSPPLRSADLTFSDEPYVFGTSLPWKHLRLRIGLSIVIPHQRTVTPPLAVANRSPAVFAIRCC